MDKADITKNRLLERVNELYALLKERGARHEIDRKTNEIFMLRLDDKGQTERTFLGVGLMAALNTLRRSKEEQERKEVESARKNWDEIDAMRNRANTGA